MFSTFLSTFAGNPVDIRHRHLQTSESTSVRTLTDASPNPAAPTSFGIVRGHLLWYREGSSLAITVMFCLEFACVFRLLVSMRKVASEHAFCVLIYMNSYIFHICFISFVLLSYLILDFVCLTLSSADTHGIAKYARTYIQRYTQTRTHTKKINKGKKGKKGKKSLWRNLAGISRVQDMEEGETEMWALRD